MGYYGDIILLNYGDTMEILWGYYIGILWRYERRYYGDITGILVGILGDTRGYYK